ncbi:hypothetical protein [Isoptericola sp. b408]|nr:hypothetical protein [Isoptericola sp. b408]MDO8150482.1 hypothetical protein [Isoptericola sp. b408]
MTAGREGAAVDVVPAQGRSFGLYTAVTLHLHDDGRPSVGDLTVDLMTA